MSESSRSYPKPRFLSVVIGLIGVALVLQGLPLVQAGGSLYYFLAGITLAAVSVLLFRGDDRGAKLYGIFLAITYLWALYEAGLDAWALMPRVAMFTVLGLWFVIPRVRRGLQQAEPSPLFEQMPTKIVLGAFAVFAITLLLTSGRYEVGTPSAAGTGQANNPSGEWRSYGASKTGTRFAAADQINLDNVTQLEKAWEIRTRVPGAVQGNTYSGWRRPLSVYRAEHHPFSRSRYRTGALAIRPRPAIGKDWILGYLPRRHLLRCA